MVDIHPATTHFVACINLSSALTTAVNVLSKFVTMNQRMCCIHYISLIFNSGLEKIGENLSQEKYTQEIRKELINISEIGSGSGQPQ